MAAEVSKKQFARALKPQHSAQPSTNLRSSGYRPPSMKSPVERLKAWFSIEPSMGVQSQVEHARQTNRTAQERLAKIRIEHDEELRRAHRS